ncbi:MAG: cell division protein FtsA [Bacteroidales bacterium]|nr:cell division protein FtsA [Bacteroidales bacterium]
MKERYLTAIDLGTSKTAICVAKVQDENVEIIHYGETKAEGIRYGSVLNPMKALNSFRKAVDGAEKELGIKIKQAVVNLPRYFVQEETATGTIQRSDKESSITSEEITNLKNIALDEYDVENEETEMRFCAIAQSFNTDELAQAMEEDVEGMVSPILAGNFKVYIGNRRSYNNIDKVFNDAEVAVAKKYFTPETTARIVLTREEMDNGVALIDMGAGVTSVSVFSKGILRHYASIPFGGNSISADIKSECAFSDILAENIKLAYGNCMPDKLANMSEKIIKIDYFGANPEKELPLRYLSEIIEARQKEIIEAMLYEIQESGYADELRNGVVVTGGAAGMTDIQNLIKNLSGYNVRVGYSLPVFSADVCLDSKSLAATSCIGMIMAAKKDMICSCIEDVPVIRRQTEEEKGAETGPKEKKLAEGGSEDGTLFGDGGIEETANKEAKPNKKDTRKDGTKKNLIWSRVKTTASNLFETFIDDKQSTL